MGLIGLILLIVSVQSAWSQKEKFHSIFIYNFSKYVKWPDSQKSNVFVIGVYGSSSIYDDLTTMATSKKVNNMPIEVKKFKSAAELDECNILYVPSSESNKIDEIVSSTKGKPILIVTDKPGSATKGAAINFVEVDGKIKFELNQANAESCGLKVASALASLAIIV